MSDLATEIRELREARGLTKAALAKAAGVSDVAISYWESGAIEQIGHLRLLALAGALGVTVSELVGDPLAEPLAARVDRLNAKLVEIRDALCGQGLQVAGWHLNGDLEPIERWFEDNDWNPEGEGES